MNAIAALGQRVIERVRGIGVATQMLLQILFSMPTLAWGEAVPVPNVPCWRDVTIDYCGIGFIYWFGIGLTRLLHFGQYWFRSHVGHHGVFDLVT